MNVNACVPLVFRLFLLNEVVRTILQTLLDRYEQPGRRNIVRVRINPRDHSAYFSAEDTRAALGREPDDTAEPLYPVDHIVIDAQVEHIAGAKMFRWAPTQRTFIQIAAYASER